MTNIVFMGTPDFSVPVLSMLIAEGYTIKAVVTQPDRPVGRKRILTPPPVKIEALKHQLPILQPEKLRRSEELEQLLKMDIDLIVTAAYGQILPKELLQVPRLGCINVHASLLPKYRGGAPIHQAIMDGEKETGVTIMYMVEKLDAGDIISQVVVPIQETDDTGTLFHKLSVAGANLLKETLPAIINGTNDRIPQDERLATYAPNITREQERIDWSKEGEAIYNHIRGLHPWPVAYTTFQGEQVKIWWGGKVHSTIEAEPGTIIQKDKEKLLVKTGNQTAISLEEIQPAGKKKMPIAVFLNGIGHKWAIGDRFE